MSIPNLIQPSKPEDAAILQEWQESGVRFTASGGGLEQAYYAAVEQLLACIVPMRGGDPVLQEGVSISAAGWRARAQLTQNCSPACFLPFPERPI